MSIDLIGACLKCMLLLVNNFYSISGPDLVEQGENKMPEEHNLYSMLKLLNKL